MQNNRGNLSLKARIAPKKDYLSKYIYSGYGVLSILIVILDQFTKNLAQLSFKGTDALSLFGDIVSIKYTVNTGIAFGFPLRGTLLLICTVGLICALIWYLVGNFKTLKLWERGGYILIVSGAISNGIDRSLNGFVIDFISLKYFAIFNVADIVITIGAILIILTQYTNFPHAKH